MTHPVSCSRLVAAATDGVTAIDRCYPILAAMNLPGDDRSHIAAALVYGALDQARAACLLVATDPYQGMFAASILLRSQLDHLMRAAFFAGPASQDQIAHFLKNDSLPQHNGQNLGAKSLAKINEAHFGWQPANRVPNLVSNHWATLSGMTHGGAALLRYYIHDDGIYPYPVSDDFLTTITNTVTLAHLGIATVMSLASNAKDERFQSELQLWFAAGRVYFAKWQPLDESIGDA